MGEREGEGVSEGSVLLHPCANCDSTVIRASALNEMRLVPFMLLLLPSIALCEEVRIALGMTRDAAVEAIKKHGGKDITSGLAVVGPKGEWLLTGIYWSFDDYDAIITLSAPNGKVSHMTYWTKKDFGESKNHRAKTEKSIRTLKLDTKTKGVSIEEAKQKKVKIWRDAHTFP